jgi:hypothetical protein
MKTVYTLSFALKYFFLQPSKNVTFMHRYQVAKYVILTNILASKESITKIKKFKEFKMEL